MPEHLHFPTIAASMLNTCATAKRRPRIIGLPPNIFGFAVIRLLGFVQPSPTSL
jgi:hypothetical protein